MDPQNPHESLFSRGGSTPPIGQLYGNPTQSSSNSPNHIESLFSNMGAPTTTGEPIPVGTSTNIYANPTFATSNMSFHDDAASSGSAPANPSTTDRQSALLSLLGTVSNPGGSVRGPSGGAPPVPQPQQVPTPPGSSHMSGNSSGNDNESQGKFLLEQLMSGNVRSNYSDSQLNLLGGSAPSPPYVPAHPEQSLRDNDSYHSRDASYQSPEAPRELPQRPYPPPQTQAQEPKPPSPARKSMFDFISPFDALASSGSSQAKKKPVPQPQPSDLPSGSEDTWTTASLTPDPKRKSVDNLMEQLTRGQAPPPQTTSPPYDPYLADEYNQSELVQPRAAPPPPLPPKPVQVLSPHSSPRLHAQQQQRPQPRSVESPVGQQQGSLSNQRNKESSPAPSQRGSWKAEGKGKGPGTKGKSGNHSQTIIYDVSQALDEIQAPREAVKSTAIALVKQDSVFLPGTTIGATHWVAYAMTKGRVRVISRSSGDRTLLQLPSTFPSSTSVTDMAVYGNRLAGVTSDGGFVVWELPEMITDDVPGHLLLCISPGTLGDGLHSVKWHPKQSETLAVASDSKIFLLELGIVSRNFRGSPLPQSELHRIAQVFNMPSRLVAFDFDVLRYALATISEDSMLTLWNIPDKLPFWSHKVRGDDAPSSITFVDDGIVIGRKNGTVFQLLSVVSKNVLATIKFVNGHQDDPDMFGHVNYDSRVQTLWVANNRRDSMIAFKIGYDNSTSASGEVKGAYFEQVVEFCGPKPTIHFVILSAEADPTGEEAHAACVAAKVPPGELALVAFSVHSTGVDQILIRREWFESALIAAAQKYPILPPAPQGDLKRSQGQNIGPVPRARTPPTSEELEAEVTRDESRGGPDSKGKKNAAGSKQKNVVSFKDSDDGGKDKKEKTADAALISESALGQALSREIRKSEESLHTRIGRLIGKEMDKQHHRLEDARAHEQAEDFTRQEKILKLISTELTRNTTRVVEMAVKNEVQNSVLPALENITRTEVRSALNEHVGGGLANYIQQSLPNEIEKLLLRPDVSNHFAGILSNNLTPLIERYVKDSVSKTFIPAYSQQSSAMHQELLHELRAEVHSVKKESLAWQNEAARGQEALIRDLEHSVRVLSDQVKFLTMNAPPSVPGPHVQQLQHSNSPGASGQLHQGSPMTQSHLRQAPVTQGPANYGQGHPPYQQQQQSPPSSMQGPWYSTSIAAPQASHPLAPPPPPPPPPQTQRSPPAQSQHEEWDDTYLAVLGTQDPRQLRELLSRSNPEVVMPLNGTGPLSQAVVLTLLHRLAGVVGETPPHEELFKQSLWWLQRTASALNTNDPLISPYIARVVPNVQQMLNTTKTRCSILPGGPQLVEAVRSLSDVQDTLNRKPM